MTPEQWDRLVAGWQPSDVDLMRAPILHDWFPAWRRGALVVVGRVSYHPTAPEGTPMQTTPVLRMAGDESWLRTRREYYRLGAKFVRNPVQEIAEKVFSERTSTPDEPWAPHPGFEARDHFPDLPLPPPEDDPPKA
jgi:hypothetical protein